MTTPYERSQFRTQFVLIAMASASLLAASGTPASAVVMSANTEASPATVSSHQRQEHGDHRIVHHDARRDVLRIDLKSEARTPAPSDGATDITTTVVDHQADQLALRARVRHLSRSGYRLMVSEIVASDGRRYELHVDYSTQPIGSRVSLRRSASGKDVRCPGAAWSIDRSVDRVAASVPNSCLGDPRWIRAGVALIAAPHDLKTSWVDDSRSRGRIGERHPKLGPRQHQAR